MKICLVTGSRLASADARRRVWEELEREAPHMVIQGGASGIDRCAADWATAQRGGVANSVFQADWTRYGKSAGPRRNKQMVDFADRMAKMGDDVVVLAFPAPDSIGTWDCVDKARAAGLTIKIIHTQEGS